MISFTFNATKHIMSGVRYLEEFDEKVNITVSASDSLLTLELTSATVPSFCYPLIVYDYVRTLEIESMLEWLHNNLENKITCSVHAHLWSSVLATFDANESITLEIDIVTRYLIMKQYVECKHRYKVVQIGLMHVSSPSVVVSQELQHLVLIKDVNGFAQMCHLLALDEEEHNTGYCTLEVKSICLQSCSINVNGTHSIYQHNNKDSYNKTNNHNLTSNILSNISIEEDTDNSKIDKYNENETSSDINNYINGCVDKNINEQGQELSNYTDSAGNNNNNNKEISHMEKEEEGLERANKRYRKECHPENLSLPHETELSKERICLTCTTPTITTSLELGSWCGSLPNHLRATACANDLVKFTTLCTLINDAKTNKLLRTSSSSQMCQKQLQRQTTQEQLTIGFDSSGMAMLRLQWKTESYRCTGALYFCANEVERFEQLQRNTLK